VSKSGKHIGVPEECYHRLKGKSVRRLHGKPVVSLGAVVEMLCADILEGE
jgi:hypothetical protein